MIFLLSLDVVQYFCGKCGKSCEYAAGLAKHMKTHKKKTVASPSLLKFLKRTPAKKIPIELKPIESKSKQVKFKLSTSSSISSVDIHSNKILTQKATCSPTSTKITGFRWKVSSPYTILHRAQDTISDSK